MHRYPHVFHRSVKSLLLVGGDGAVRGWVGHAGEHESVAHLVVVQEGLVGLVNGSSLDLSGAGGAGSSTARVWQINSCALEKVMSVLPYMEHHCMNDIDGPISAQTKDAHPSQCLSRCTATTLLDHMSTTPARGDVPEPMPRQHRAQPAPIEQAITHKKLTGFLSGIEDVHIVSALDHLVSGRSLEGDLVGHDLEGAGSTSLQEHQWCSFNIICRDGCNVRPIVSIRFHL